MLPSEDAVGGPDAYCKDHLSDSVAEDCCRRDVGRVISLLSPAVRDGWT